MRMKVGLIMVIRLWVLLCLLSETRTNVISDGNINNKKLDITPENTNKSSYNMCNCRQTELHMPVRGSTSFKTEYVPVSNYLSKALKVKVAGLKNRNNCIG